jgi:hypothetical protein
MRRKPSGIRAPPETNAPGYAEWHKPGAETGVWRAGNTVVGTLLG